MKEWYQKTAEEVLKELGSSRDKGLTGEEASRRLAAEGPNALREKKGRNVLRIILDQFTSLMILILLGAALISAALGDIKDAVVILAIVILNGVLGFFQEYRAEKAMEALKKLSVPAVRVQRDGKLMEVPARDLVIGDLVFLEAGNLVPADGRLLECSNLRVQEASLTGESESVEKITDTLPAAGQSLGDRHNVVYMGTVVTYGRGLMAVTACGMKTELGKVAQMIQAVVSGPTPLQKRLDQLGKVLAGASLVIVSVIFALGILRGEELRLMFMTAVSLAVAAVPEGLPAVVTISLALGAHRMLKRKALIRKLSAVETLGSVTVICSDKTGTLTQNRMTVCVLDAADHRLDYVIPEPSGAADLSAQPKQELHPSFALMLTAGALCNDASHQSSGSGEMGRSFGDPTETALVIAARHFGFEKHALEKIFPRVLEIPFDSERKMMTTAHIWPSADERQRAGFGLAPGLPEGDRVLFTKGALDSLLKVSSSVWTDEGIRPMDEAWKQRIWAAHDGLAASGKRVLGTGFRILKEASGMEKVPETDLCFSGLIGMIDPPRVEAREAVQLCLSAGIRPVMITGDHPLTAAEIAGQLGIDKAEGVVTGQELESMEEAELSAKAVQVSVFARVSPAHKLRIVEALQKRGSIVAMTGDGVNDAPALKKADIGVAMGITGTDVSKQAASMVLMDDNFATIVAAVREGRVIYDNIRKFIRYLLATNTSEILVMLAAPFLGMPLPLLPLQILWINLVTDGFPALALAFEPAEENVMKRKPHPPGESIFARGLGRHVVVMGVLMAALSLGAGAVYWHAGAGHWQTMVFMIIAMTQMGHVMAIRSENGYAFKMHPLSNKPLFMSLWIVISAQLAVIYVPLLQQIFKTQPLPLPDLLLCFGSGILVFLTVEIEKFLNARFRRGKAAEAA